MDTNNNIIIEIILLVNQKMNENLLNNNEGSRPSDMKMSEAIMNL